MEVERAASRRRCAEPARAGARPQSQDRRGAGRWLYVLGLHTLFGLLRMFLGVSRLRFVHRGRGRRQLQRGGGTGHLQRHIETGNQRYVDYMQERGLAAESVTAVGIDVVQKVTELARGFWRSFPMPFSLGGNWCSRTRRSTPGSCTTMQCSALQRRFYQQGLPLLICRSGLNPRTPGSRRASRFKDFQFGLNLVAQNSGQQEFHRCRRGAGAGQGAERLGGANFTYFISGNKPFGNSVF